MREGVEVNSTTKPNSLSSRGGPQTHALITSPSPNYLH